jgi:hypothetical protein
MKPSVHSPYSLPPRPRPRSRPSISCNTLAFVTADEEFDCFGYWNITNNNVLLQNKLVRKLFCDEPEGKKLNVPTPKVRVSVAKPTALSATSSSKQHKKTVRIVFLFMCLCYGLLWRDPTIININKQIFAMFGTQ